MITHRKRWIKKGRRNAVVAKTTQTARLFEEVRLYKTLRRRQPADLTWCMSVKHAKRTPVSTRASILRNPKVYGTQQLRWQLLDSAQVSGFCADLVQFYFSFAAWNCFPIPPSNRR